MKKLEFKEAKFPVFEIAFWILVLFSLISIVSVIKNNLYSLCPKGYDYPLETIKINIEYNKKDFAKDSLFCFNDYCKNSYSANNNNNFYAKFSFEDNEFFNSKVKRLILAYPKKYTDFENNIKIINIHVGMKNFYYTKEDLKNFDRKTTSILLEKQKQPQEYNLIQFPQINNYRGILYNISSVFLSLFYKWHLFIIPYFWLFCALLIYIFKKDKFKYKLDFKLTKSRVYWILGIIILIGIYLRLTGINYYPLWTDEVYTKNVALENLKTCFQDPGNPPLFFIIDYLFTKIFSTSVFALRFPSLFFGVLSIPMIFLIFREISLKSALFASFLFCVNTINIYHSQEARGYTLSAFLIFASIYILFKYLKNPTTKNLIFYGILTILCVNHNYYLILFAFCNFIWGVVDLIQNRNKKEIPKFTIVNFIACLSFLPYFVISSKNALAYGFNAWIPKLDSENFFYIINNYFINKYLFLFLCIIALIWLIFCYLPEKYLEKLNLKINPSKADLFIYLIYTIAFVLIIASLISIFIKPIVHKRTLLSINGLLFMLEALMITLIVEFRRYNKFLYSIKITLCLILTLIYFSLTAPIAIRNLCNVYNFMNFIVQDIKNYPLDYQIHAITCDSEKYLREYPQIQQNKRIIWHFFNTNDGTLLNAINKSAYTKKDKKVVIYFNTIGVDISKPYFDKPNVSIFWSNLTPVGRVVFK